MAERVGFGPSVVFAISGAASGVKSRLDVFGVSVLAFVAGNAGGMAHDVLIAAVPPAATSNWRYVAASLIAAVATFLWYPSITRVQRIVLLFDAAGLATFAVAARASFGSTIVPTTRWVG